MANNIYTIDLLATAAGTVILDTDGIDWLVFSADNLGSSLQPANILLKYVILDGVSTQAIGQFTSADNISKNLQIGGAIENARGSNGVDFILGNELGNILYGDLNSTGLGGSDTIWGDFGNDTIYGGAGQDELAGDGGNDNLRGDAGVDTITGGVGADIIEGGSGADFLSGGEDTGDRVSYSMSSAAVNINLTFGATTTGSGGDAQGDQIDGFFDAVGSAHNDVISDTFKSTLSIGRNDNRFYGGAGDDRLNLGGGADRGYGGTGNDIVLGEAGNDTLWGDAGSDKLYGGLGADYLTGGLGADLFVFSAVTESTNLAAGRDRIADFQNAQADKIYLRSIDADASLALDQAFVFIGAAGFDGRHGLLRAVVSGANTMVYADLNGDMVADFSITVLNTTNMVASDFVL
jgi:serralysin